MLDQLDVRPGNRVLEIGASTGYNAGPLAQLTGHADLVTTIDIDPAVTEQHRRGPALHPPSRYCLPDIIGDEAWSRFGGMPTGYRRVRAICDHVNTSGFGVCRDFTHLAISFRRSLNIPARYVFGCLPFMDVAPTPEPTDFAAWMEVWLGVGWWTFDPATTPAARAASASAVAGTRRTWRWRQPSACPS